MAVAGFALQMPGITTAHGPLYAPMIASAHPGCGNEWVSARNTIEPVAARTPAALTAARLLMSPHSMICTSPKAARAASSAANADLDGATMTSSIRSRQRCWCSDWTTARLVSKVSVPRMTEMSGMRVSDFTSKEPLQQVAAAPDEYKNLNS